MHKSRFVILTLSAAALVFGHDLFVLPDLFFPTKGATLTMGFHVGDSFPESEVSGRFERLQSPKLIWKGGSAPFKNLRVAGNRDVGDVTIGGSGELIAAVSTSPSLIELDPPKFSDYLKEEGLTDVIAWRAAHGESDKPGKERYSKYAKSVLLAGSTNGFADHVVGFVIEIVPESDPYKLKAGDMLPIRVLFRGKPASDLQTESAWAGAQGKKTLVVGRTGPDGRLSVPVASPGKWRIHTIKMERCADAAIADWESSWASMTFEVR